MREEPAMRRKLVLDGEALTRELGRPGPPFEISEVSVITRLSRAKVHALIQAKILTAFKPVGVNKVLVERAAVLDYLARSRGGTAAVAVVA